MKRVIKTVGTYNQRVKVVIVLIRNIMCFDKLFVLMGIESRETQMDLDH